MEKRYKIAICILFAVAIVNIAVVASYAQSASERLSAMYPKEIAHQ